MIDAFTGLPGQGKTYHMTKKAYRYCLLKKKDVYANYKLDFGEKLNHRVHYFKELSELDILEISVYFFKKTRRRLKFWSF